MFDSSGSKKLSTVIEHLCVELMSSILVNKDADGKKMANLLQPFLSAVVKDEAQCLLTGAVSMRDV